MRIWIVYLTLTAALLYWFAFVKSAAPPILALFALLGVIRLIDLWRLRSLGRTFAFSLLFIHLVGPIVYISVILLRPVAPEMYPGDRSMSGITLIFNFVTMLVGVVGLIFFNRPAVKALFQNQKSAISNQQS